MKIDSAAVSGAVGAGLKPASTPVPWDATAFFIDLMWPGKAMVFPAQPVPDSDRGAVIHVPGPWIPAQSLPRTMMRGPE